MRSLEQRSQLKRSLKLALYFQASWIIAALIVLIAGGTPGIGLIIAMMFILWVPAIFQLVTGITLPTAIHVHFHAFITASSIAGSAFGFYALIPHWDSIVHVDSGILLAWFGFFLVRSAEDAVHRTFPLWFSISVGFATPMAFAALWEISEFISDRFLGTTTQADLEDTIVDMAVAVIGAVVAILLALWLTRPKSVLPRSLHGTERK